MEFIVVALVVLLGAPILVLLSLSRTNARVRQMYDRVNAIHARFEALALGLHKLGTDVKRLEESVARIGSMAQERGPTVREAPPGPPEPKPRVPPQPERGVHERTEAVESPKRSVPPPLPLPGPTPTPRPQEGIDQVSPAGRAPDVARMPPTPTLIDEAKAWLLGGNTVVRVGVVVLFFGVAFFLNYAIDQGWLPIEIRLVLAALGGLALVGGGWRLRRSRRDYALVLQGGGIGIVYLTVFAAANVYSLIAAGPGLALMVVLVALSSALAVLQDARSLAVLATLAGFLAPLLVGEEGSHVALFAYYAALNLGVLGIAWFKAWRPLNLLGFTCTFVFSAAWGSQYYQPAYFSTVEPFLVAFFLLYVAVPVLFATRQQTAGTHFVDGTLLFGTPLVASGLQTALVRDFEYGMAFSALGAGVFYVSLAWVLWRRLPDTVRLFVEVFLSLGVAFGTLAIPLAFDGTLTGSAWALEGAGLVWVGVRQRRQLALASGVILQGVAGWSLLSGGDGPARDIPIVNAVYIGALFVSLAGLFSAWYLDEHESAWIHGTPRTADVLRRWGPSIPPLLLWWGLLWWVGAGIREISTHVPSADRFSVYLVFSAGSAAALTGLRQPLAWPRVSRPILVLLPAMVLVALGSFARLQHPFAGWGGAAWCAAFAAHYWSQWRLESEWPEAAAGYWHAGMLWLGVFLLSWEASWLTGRLAGGSSTWQVVAWALVPGATLIGVPVLTRLVSWPFGRFAGILTRALTPIAGVVTIWLLLSSVERGDPSPLPYLPVVNPLELSQCLALAIIMQWSRTSGPGVSEQARWTAWSMLAFVVLNGIIARAVHFYAGVAFTGTALWSSARYQTAVSVVWTLAALFAMLGARWLKQRSAWFAGAALLTAVVAKLFLVDLNDVGTVPRIVSFVVVGLLILLVGYVSPLPPRSTDQGQP